MNKGNRILKTILASSLTWAVIAITLIMIWGFVQWFQPSVSILLAVLGAGIFLLLLWPVLFIRSDEFRRKYNMAPDEVKMDELEKLIESCIPAFKKPAMECLSLAKTIQKEFKNRAFEGEVETLLQNLNELAVNHIELLERSKKFGTRQQQQTMNKLLEEQAGSVENSLTALKRFSGNLTLFDLHAKDQKEIDRELQDINLGLQEAIREVRND